MALIKENIPLNTYCTLGIGGPAQYYSEASSIAELQELFSFCKQKALKFFILGKGSNCLFDDRGFAGLVICNKINFCTQQQNIFHVGAGYSFALLGQQTAAKGFSGLEFASGIPATVGGAIFMNAGASNQETCNALVSVKYLHASGEIECFEKKKLQFAYRFSSFQKMHGAIISATFELASQPIAKERQKLLLQNRIKTQPYRAKSAGCAFRNPSSQQPAGKIIEECGLKGFSIAAASVSEQHANFIINKEKATSTDMLALIKTIQNQVLQKTGMQLETEIRYIPYD